VRVSKEQDHVLISPRGLSFAEVTAANLVSTRTCFVVIFQSWVQTAVSGAKSWCGNVWIISVRIILIKISCLQKTHDEWIKCLTRSSAYGATHSSGKKRFIMIPLSAFLCGSLFYLYVMNAHRGHMAYKSQIGCVHMGIMSHMQTIEHEGDSTQSCSSQR